jgi:hypothetical protein
MSIKAGIGTDFDNSMAEAMENALAQEYQALKGEPLPSMGQDDRRMLLSAIAQGVVRYLKDNLDAFDVSVDVTQVTGEPGAPLIQSDNPGEIQVDGDGGGGGDGKIPIGEAKVTQLGNPGNLVRSRGTGTVEAMDTTGVLY